jgi:hypothetical protein
MDTTNLPQLATEITAALTPALPFILAAGKEVAQSVVYHLAAR